MRRLTVPYHGKHQSIKVDCQNTYRQVDTNKYGTKLRYPVYTENRREGYIQDLADFFNEYAKKEKLHIDVLPYHTEIEKQELLKKSVLL